MNGKKETGTILAVFLVFGNAFAEPAIWETDFGDEIVSLTGDDDSEEPVTLSFNFPFDGTDYTTVYVGTNGALQLGSLGDDGSIDYEFWEYMDEFLQDSAPIISPFNTDLDLTTTGTIHFNDFGDRAVITWNEVGTNDNETALNTFQVQLYSNGKIVFGYNGILDDSGEDLLGDLDEGIVVGITPSDLGSCEDTAIYDLNGGVFEAGTTIHERWCYDTADSCYCSGTYVNGPVNTEFDLDQFNVVFTPVEDGYKVSSGKDFEGDSDSTCFISDLLTF